MAKERISWSYKEKKEKVKQCQNPDIVGVARRNMQGISRFEAPAPGAESRIPGASTDSMEKAPSVGPIRNDEAKADKEGGEMMSAPAPPSDQPLTLGALEGATLTTAAAEGAYIVSQTLQNQPISMLMVLGVGLVSFAGYLGYKAYRGT